MILLAVVILASCSRPPAPIGTQSDRPQQPAAVDACTLVSSAEVEKILGAPVSETKPISRNDERFSVSQCFITLPEARDSLNIEIIRRGPGANGKDPRELWEELFHTDKELGVRRDGSPKKPIPREIIAGIGDEAFWTGHTLGSTLHVLKGNTSLRINVGGPGDDTLNRQRLSRLAEILLERLG